MYLKQIVVAYLATASGWWRRWHAAVDAPNPVTLRLMWAKGTPSGTSRASIWPNPGSGPPLEHQSADRQSHWIYPGDVLHLSWVNGGPRLGKASQGGKQVIRLA